MAYAVNWQIPFVALDGNKFRIEILNDNYTGDPVTLRGAASPIETSEDNSENLFIPIRKQTGKLSIADNGYDASGNEFDYTELIPNYILDYQVRLWQIASDNSETLRWIGYIKPDSLTSRLFDAVSIREFQLVCPLGAMEEMPVSFSNTATNLGTVKTMGQILHTALSSVNISWGTVYKQNNTHYREDITAKVSLLNFISDNLPTHTTPPTQDLDSFTATWTEDGTTWGSIVEEICRFWGWTLYSRGLDIIIVTRGQYPKFGSFAFAQLLSESATGLYDITDVYIDMESDLTYASTNHTECRQLGYRNISVHSNVNEKEIVIDPDFQKLQMSYWLGGADVHGIVHWSGDGYYYVLRRLGASGDQQDTRVAYFDNYQIEENRYLPNGNNAPFVVYYGDGWTQDEFPTKTKFNLTRGIVCYAASTVSRVTFFVKTLEDICVPKGAMICIQATAQLSYNPDPDFPTGGFTTGDRPSISDAPLSNANTAGPYSEVKNRGTKMNPLWDIVPKLEGRTIKVQLSIGDWFWDNDSQMWLNNPSSRPSFDLTVREDGSIVSPVNGNTGTGILFDDHNGSNGFCIIDNGLVPEQQQICGRLKLMILNNTLAASFDRLVSCVLTNLTIGIYNEDSKLYPQAKGSHTYKTVASTDFHRNMNVTLSMAAGDKNKYGLGQLYNPDISLLTTVAFRTGDNTYTDQLPEEKLLDTMANAYQYVTPQYTIEVRDNEQACLPYAKFVGHWADDSGIYHLQYVSHKWREGTMKLTLINK